MKNPYPINTKEYTNIHRWIHKHFGSATTCENPEHKDIRGVRSTRKYDKKIQTIFCETGNEEVTKAWAEGIMTHAEVCRQLKVSSNTAYSVLARTLKELHYQV